MKVAIDTTPLQTGHKSRGIGVYTKNLTKSLQSIDKNNEYIFFSRGQKIPKVDLVHYPYFDLFFLTLPLFKRCPTVVTIFDVIPLIFWKEFNPGIRAALKLQIQKFLLNNNIDRIITISNSSKKDIENYLNLPPNKIDITYLATDPIFRPIKDTHRLEKVRKKYELPTKFLLYVGDVNYNKNLPRLLEALIKVSIALVIVGEAAKNEKLQEVDNLIKLSKKLKIEKKIIRLGFINDIDLVSLYNLATCYIQPSLYEGFGLPVLEAMSCGCPVICSDSSSLSEVGGNAPVYVKSNSVDSIVDGINKVINFYTNKPQKYQGLKQNSIARSRGFNWQKTAIETIEVYKKAIF